MLAINKLVISRLPQAAWPIFSSFPIFLCCFIRLKAFEICWQNMRNSEILVMMYSEPCDT